jgi:hypothetical protein
MALRQLAGQCDDKTTCPGVWIDEDQPDEVIIVGAHLVQAPVPLGPGEVAVRLSIQLLQDTRLGT